MSGDPYTGIDNLEVLEEAVRYNRFLVDLIIDSNADASSALDYGAGMGTLALAVRARGLEVACVELDTTLQERLRDEGFQVHANLGSIPDGTCPFVYSVNVLEHILDDAGALAELYSKLSPGGQLLIYVPAFQLLYSSMDEKVGHHRRYRKGPLRDLAEGAGFQVVRMEYADSLGFLASMLYKLIGSRQGDITPSSIRFYDRFVFPLSQVLDKIGASQLLGKNLIMLLRRPTP